MARRRLEEQFKADKALEKGQKLHCDRIENICNGIENVCKGIKSSRRPKTGSQSS